MTSIRRTLWATALTAICGCLAAVGADEAAEKAPLLTAAAQQAILKAFPAATIDEVDTESEDGVEYFEVELEQAGKKLDVEVSAEGVIGEVGSAVQMEELPEAVAKIVVDTTKGARITRVEKHEVRGVAKDGKFVPVTPPEVGFEVKYTVNGRPAFIHVKEAEAGTARLTKLVIGKTGDDDDADDADDAD